MTSASLHPNLTKLLFKIFDHFLEKKNFLCIFSSNTLISGDLFAFRQRTPVVYTFQMADRYKKKHEVRPILTLLHVKYFPNIEILPILYVIFNRNPHITAHIS